MHVHDPREIEAHIRASLRRSAMSREDYVARLERFTRAAHRILAPRPSVVTLFETTSGITMSEFYGALWMLLIADVFRDGESGSGITGALRLTADEIADFRHIATLMYERYFGVPVPDEHRAQR